MLDCKFLTNRFFESSSQVGCIGNAQTFGVFSPFSSKLMRFWYAAIHESSERVSSPNCENVTRGCVESVQMSGG